ncbi:MAG: 50S ribosomal protein L35 [Clostridiales bacterium]|nr:50S ribosomal protein L35 [Clostridiales bacterium]
MPKIKTRSAVAKRFKLTKTGKVKHMQQNRRHKLTAKSTKRKRGLRTVGYVSPASAANIKKMIPYA